MPDWAIVLVAAFSGGLAGAVLQPVVGLGADILLADRNVRKSRQRTLRKMLVAHMAWGRQLADLVDVFWRYDIVGQYPPPEHWAEDVRRGTERLPFWEPERIADDRLRDLARDYHGRVQQLDADLLQWTSDELRQQRHHRRLLMVYKLHMLQSDIVRRMDELNWPEVDD